MKRYTLPILLLPLLILACCSGEDENNDDPQPAYTLAIENVRLFDGDKVMENVTVLVTDDKVEKIATGDPGPYTAGMIIDGTGRTLIPGLIDGHAHVFGSDAMEQLAEAAEAGVLTVIDPFNFSPDLTYSLRLAGQGKDNLAYYVGAGIGVTVKDGFVDNGQPTISSVEEVPQFIQDRVDEGSEFIKIVVDPYISPQAEIIPMMSDEQAQACINEAHAHSLLCMAHTPTFDLALKVAEMGADGILHIWFRDKEQAPAEGLTALKNTGAAVNPTARFVQKRDELNWSGLSFDLLLSEIHALHQAGIPIFAGSDAPNHNIQVGPGLYDELEIYAEAGMTPVEVLKSATSIPSEIFGLGTRGHIAEQAPADMVLVEGDPTTNISDVRNVVNVWKRGVKVVPSKK